MNAEISNLNVKVNRGGVGGRNTREKELVESARAFVPKLRVSRAEIERLARIPDEMVKEFEDAGFYSMMVPRAYGGLQTSVSTYMDVVVDLGQGDAGVAWAVSLVNVCNWVLSSLYPRHVVDEVFANPNARVAGMFDTRGVKARRVAGGVLVEKGMWFFNSGVYQAQWNLLSVPTWNEAGEAVGKAIALFPMSDVKILNDWDTSGLRGSGSSNVSAENVFIPDERIIDLKACAAGTVKRPFPDDALWHSAFAPITVVILVFPMLGLGKHMLEKYLEVIPTREIRITQYAKQSEAAVTHLNVGVASAKIDAATLLMAKACKEIDECAERREYMPLMDRARIVRDCAFADRLIWEAVDLLASATSGSFARRTNPMNGLWQDAKVAMMHPFVSYFSNMEMYGRLLCGIEPPMMPV